MRTGQRCIRVIAVLVARGHHGVNASAAGEFAIAELCGFTSVLQGLTEIRVEGVGQHPLLQGLV
nr:MAG TPA: hypothetical protein [Caudoviricetes sp.]